MEKKKLAMIVFLGLCCDLFFIYNHPVHAQEESEIRESLKIPDSTHVQILTTSGGSKNIGRIIEIGKEDIQFKTDMGILTVPIKNIRKMDAVSTTEIKDGKYWFPNPNTTRLYFAPTAYTLEKGEGYFADYYLFFPMVAYGITERLTIGAGFSLLPTTDIADQIFYVMPKLELVSSKKISAAAGVLMIKLPGFDDDDDDDDDSPLVGILYGVGTVGKPDANFTFGAGFGFVGSDLAEKPMITLGAEKRLSRRISFVTENWIFPGVDQPLISYGFRLLGEKLSVDLALFNTIGDDMLVPGFPYVDFVFSF